MTVEQAVGEPLLIQGIERDRGARRARVADLLGTVGLPAEAMGRYPHEFSGGQRQRIGIARALASSPELLVADEPVSALDVSIQAQVVNLLLELRVRLGLAMLFIAHDLAVVEHVADRIAVMYLGHIVELADSRELCRHPLHPYTEALLSAVPVPEPGAKRARIVLAGEIPARSIRPPAACSVTAAAMRCRPAAMRCRRCARRRRGIGRRASGTIFCDLARSPCAGWGFRDVPSPGPLGDPTSPASRRGEWGYSSFSGRMGSSRIRLPVA